MVVADTGLVARRGSRRLDPTHDARVDQGREGVVHGLLGDGPDLASGGVGDDVSGGVGAGGDRLEHSDPLRGHLHSVIAQDLR